ncbi:hypothetical protein E2C01_076413 [Portunus trituberculatus]|uniref:Uncharacterized protein n=1 Tax=Portunus trituberculatus TaxID=210409 RepID=A0A5B7IIT5_PORTR|nr:hypothetical protein [Portunus trituberculatus]
MWNVCVAWWVPVLAWIPRMPMVPRQSIMLWPATTSRQHAFSSMPAPTLTLLMIWERHRSIL